MKKIILIFSFMMSIMAYAQHKKVALVIGNQKYSGHFSTLHTPKNDAFAMYNVLKKLNFEVLVGYDIPRDSMSFYLNEFAKMANGAEMALFYYSGHAGIDKNEDYYLAPSGSYNSASTLIADCYSFSTIENRIKKIGTPTKLYIIDACRNSIDGNKDIMRYTPKTLTEKLTKAKGSVYCFATGVNKTAGTGYGKYSIFTESLLNHLGSFDNLFSIWSKVSDEVTRKDSEQIPILQDTPDQLSKQLFINSDKIDLYPENLDGQDIYSILTHPADATIIIKNDTIKSGEKFTLKYGQKYNVTISAPKYATYKDSIIATPYKTNYSINLEELAAATLNVRCNKYGATVYFDGEKMGNVPISIDTYTGTHSLKITYDGYYAHNARPTLQAGTQTYNANLTKDFPWFWELDEDGSNIVNYHYSPKYQIGLSYMYHFDNSPFSIGATVATSLGFYRNLKLFEVESSASIVLGGEPSTSTQITIDDGTGKIVSATITSSTTYNTYTYSSEFDPYNEVKKYDSNCLLLGNVGFNVCNGIMLEGGLGAAFHKKRYYMPNTYTITKKTITNNLTGELIGEPKYEYTSNGEDKWYKSGEKWSPAIRLGTRFFIPLDRWNEYSLTFGGGYTYLPINNEFSSWDISLGFCWYF